MTFALKMKMLELVRVECHAEFSALFDQLIASTSGLQHSDIWEQQIRCRLHFESMREMYRREKAKEFTRKMFPTLPQKQFDRACSGKDMGGKLRAAVNTRKGGTSVPPCIQRTETPQ
jgi:hypothetical protein